MGTKKSAGKAKVVSLETLICALFLVAFGCLPTIVFATDAGPGITTGEKLTKLPGQPGDKGTELTTEEAVEQAAEKAAARAVEKATEKAATQVTEQVLEKAVEKAAVKAAEKAAVKDEQKARRPAEWRGATKVYFFIYVVDIDEIDGANQNFTANVYIRLRWEDPRLANPGGVTRQVSLQEVWNPRVLLANRQGLVSKSLPDVVDVRPDGTVLYYQRYTGKLSQILDLSSFPHDTHEFTIHFVAAGYRVDEVEFVADSNQGVIGGMMAEQLSLPDWEILKAEALALPYVVLKTASNPGFAFRFQAKRYFIYYLWQVVLPLAVVVVMSWAGFWIGREHVGVRIGVATSSILTLIAHRFVLANLLPRLPYMTRLDYFTVGCTLLVFLALNAVVATSYCATDTRYERYARKIDIATRGFFPVVFICLLFWFVSG